MRESVYDQDTSKLLFEGFAKKHARGRFRSSWQSRYFVAEGHYLKYYASAQRKKLKGAIDLNALRSVTRGPPESESAKGSREIHLLFDCSNGHEDAVDGEDGADADETDSDVLTMVLRTPTAQERVLWCAALKAFTTDNDTTGKQPQAQQKQLEAEDVEEPKQQGARSIATGTGLRAQEAQRKLSRSGITLRFDNKQQVRHSSVSMNTSADTQMAPEQEPRREPGQHDKRRLRQRVANRAAKEKAKERAQRWSQLTRNPPAPPLAQSELYDL